MYLAAIIDWFSRCVLAWELSNTLEADFCISALEDALRRGQPGISNTDQGVQFTSFGFIDRLQRDKIQIGMDGRGRCFDNIFVERLWRSVRYEDVYLRDYTAGDVRKGLGKYFSLYNDERMYQSLDYRTPAQVYCPGLLAGAMAWACREEKQFLGQPRSPQAYPASAMPMEFFKNSARRRKTTATETAGQQLHRSYHDIALASRQRRTAPMKQQQKTTLN